MNIFVLDVNPWQCAVYMGDKHVLSQVRETAQLLCTAHRVLEDRPYYGLSKTGRRVKRYEHADPILDLHLYQATHVNHPCAVWARNSIANYAWLYEHFNALLYEYNFRYDKTHACSFLIPHLSIRPRGMTMYAMTSFPLAMPDEHKISSDPVECYREYYKKAKTHLHKWTRRSRPYWLEASNDERYWQRELDERC